MVSGGLTREYIVFRPSRATGPRPAVLLLHGGLGTGAQMERYTDFDLVAASASIVAVYPQGIDRQWNDRRGPGVQSDVDDERFLLDLIDRLSAAGVVDPDRVYIAGISNGALMALDMACNQAGRIAGVAIIAGSLPQGYRCAPSRPIPIIFFHGTADRFIPYAGGRIAGQFTQERGSVVSAQESIDFFVRNEGCRTRYVTRLPDPTPPDGTQATIHRYADCAPGGAVESVVIEGGGHSWPGARQGVMLDYLLGTASRAVDACSELWRFFARAGERQ